MQNVQNGSCNWGHGKGKIILEIWGLTRGGGAKYKAAEAEYHRIVDGEGG
ncbi:hypothetical protein QUA70_22065 [Microcoleus sp. LAD1_D5]